jgi:hypothetical protein
LDPGSEIRDLEWVKIRIQVKNPGSATLGPGSNRHRIRDSRYHKVLGILKIIEKNDPGW